MHLIHSQEEVGRIEESTTSTGIVQEFKDSTDLHKRENPILALFVTLTPVCWAFCFGAVVTGNALRSELTWHQDLLRNSGEMKGRSFKGPSEGRLDCLACQSSFPLEKPPDCKAAAVVNTIHH